MTEKNPLVTRGFTWSNKPAPEEPDVVDKMAALEDPEGEAGQRVAAFEEHQNTVMLDVMKLAQFAEKHKDDDRTIIVDATTEGSFVGVFRLDKIMEDQEDE